MLTIGAIVLFSLVSLSVNQLMVNHTDAIYGQQAEFFASKLAQRFIEEAKVKAFDETTIVGHPLSMPAGFTSALGPEPGELNRDDVDDFIVTNKTISTDLGPMNVSIAVKYVQETSLDSEAGTQTFYKKMTVTVESDYLTSPVKANYVFAYQKNP